jgi:ketosteroid isomerase-like protein
MFAMTSAENKKLMEEIFAGLANRNGTLLIERMADDFRWINIGTNKWSGAFEGKAAVLRDLLALLRAKLVERSRTVAHRFIAEGDYVIVEARGDNVTKKTTIRQRVLLRVSAVRGSDQRGEGIFRHRVDRCRARRSPGGAGSGMISTPSFRGARSANPESRATTPGFRVHAKARVPE